MFEQESAEYKESRRNKSFKSDVDKVQIAYENYLNNLQQSFQDGMIKGYDKANEWHYVKDGDLPPKELEEKQLLVRVRNYTEDYIFAYYMLDKYYSKNGKRFYSDIDCDYPINTKDIIAWKEIVFPRRNK